MNRKGFIVLLTLATLASCFAWGISYIGISGGRCVYTKPDIDPIPQGSIVSHALTLHDGIIHIEKSRLPAGPISSELSAKVSKLFKAGWSMEVLEEEYDAALGILYTPSLWYPRIHRVGGIAVVTVPLWLTTIILGAWPAVALWRGPFRRWRRRRRGLCLKCGYNLAGTVSGVCSECGEAVA